ncbi:MAG: hypothetical protein K6T30_00035 [Alicyclobacillus sp.]|nr:hypothetical protein [Alicyclobacillus sp.]
MWQKAIFEMMGGEEKLNEFVDEFARRIKADPELGPLYPEDMSRLKELYKNFAVEMLGGPKRWSENRPVDLHEAHAHIPITKERADAMVNCAMDTMNHFRVPHFVQNAALERLEDVIYSMVNTDTPPVPPNAQPPAADPPQFPAFE